VIKNIVAENLFLEMIECLLISQQTMASEKMAAPATIASVISKDPFNTVPNSSKTVLDGARIKANPVTASIMAEYVRNDFI